MRGGGYEPSLVVVPGPPIPSFPFARPGEIRFLERSEVIGREDCWREIPIHESPLLRLGGKRKCAPAHQLKKGALEAYLIIILKGERVPNLSI